MNCILWRNFGIFESNNKQVNEENKRGKKCRNIRCRYTSGAAMTAKLRTEKNWSQANRAN